MVRIHLRSLVESHYISVNSPLFSSNIMQVTLESKIENGREFAGSNYLNRVRLKDLN